MWHIYSNHVTVCMHVLIIIIIGNSNQSDLPMVILVIVIVVSFGGITTLITIIAILVRVHRRIQMRLLSATQTTTAPEPVTISGVYEEPDCQFNLQDNTTL